MAYMMCKSIRSSRVHLVFEQVILVFVARFLQTSIAEAVLMDDPEEPSYGYLFSWADKAVEPEAPTSPEDGAEQRPEPPEEEEKLLSSRLTNTRSEKLHLPRLHVSTAKRERPGWEVVRQFSSCHE